jgi:hypothetical protein
MTSMDGSGTSFKIGQSALIRRRAAAATGAAAAACAACVAAGVHWAVYLALDGDVSFAHRAWPGVAELFFSILRTCST